MRSHMAMVVLAFVVVVVLLISTVAYKVDFTEWALIKTFGATTKEVDGRVDAGLHFKWPWPIEKLVRYDARTFVFEDTSTEIPTHDQQNVIVTLYCAWRIEDPRRFHGSIETTKAAQEQVRRLLRDAKGAAIAQHDMDSLVNTDPKKMRIPQIELEVLDAIAAQAKTDYGVQVVQVGIKSLALPKSVTTAVIDAMKEERQREVTELESAGKSRATAIKARARAASIQITEFAKRKADAIRSEGIRASADIYKTFEQDEPFSMFLRWLESLETELGGRSVMILDPSQMLALRYFNEGPSLPEIGSAPPAGGRSAKSPSTGPAGPGK